MSSMMKRAKKSNLPCNAIELNKMYFFDNRIKPQNISRVVIILVLATILKVSIGDGVDFGPRYPYVFVIFGFFIAAVIAGELSRRILRFLVPLRILPKNKHHEIENLNKIKNNKSDIEALNFGIIWSIIWICLSLWC